MNDIYTNSRVNRTGEEPALDGPNCQSCGSRQHLVPHRLDQDMTTIAGDPSLLGHDGGGANWPTHARCEKCGHVQQITTRLIVWMAFAVGARLQRHWRTSLQGHPCPDDAESVCPACGAKVSTMRMAGRYWVSCADCGMISFRISSVRSAARISSSIVRRSP